MTLTPLPPPHPAPHGASGWTVPAGACDAHCHIFGPQDRFPYLPGRAYQPAETPLERYREMAGALGLARAVFVQPAVYGTDHAAMLDALERGEGAYAGVGIIDASVRDADLARMHAAGFRGARFNYVGHLGARPSRGDVLAVMDRVAPLGWHLVFHVDAGALADEAGFLAELPCPLVIDHMARLDAAAGVQQPGFAALLELAALPHVWTKISAADRMSADLSDAVPFMAALAAAAPSRTLWGTDWPHPNSRWMPDDGDLLDLLARAVPGEAARTAILVDNPARLYAFT
ncbi:amidohydrolase family protein [Novosphingobium resinovorum]|uniref:amidohydrolase family protein n=1 Tax=Novosphingobium resinovorum TaxID=158500 RepID=UPI002ED6A31C|nr:amidohydrolase family protein [Novosphingobium resinovorum]